MGFLWPVKRETGVRKSEAELAPPEKIRIAEDIQRDQLMNLQRGVKLDVEAIELGVRLLKGAKGFEGFFDELLGAVTAPTPTPKAAKA